MKNIFIGLLMGLSFIATTAFASGEWSDWWSLSFPNSGANVMRIYDRENKLVCWIFNNSQSYNAVTGGISCVPSLELNNPLYK